MSCMSQKGPIPAKHTLLWQDPDRNHCPQLTETFGDPIFPPWLQQLHGEVITSPKASLGWGTLLGQHLCPKLPNGKGQEGLGQGRAGAVGLTRLAPSCCRCRRSGFSAVAHPG